MGKIYFVRHGESEWNVTDQICGQTDVPLTEKGHKQAEETGKNIVESGISADLILCSPLLRAKQTAQHIAEMTGIPLQVEPRLVEQNFGVWEGASPRNSKEFHEAKKEFLTRYGKGESMFQLAQRIYNLLDELKATDKNYILVAHNGISRVIRSYFGDMTNEEYAAYGVKNCSVTMFDFSYDAVVFDMDGVIFDSETMYINDLIRFFKQHDIEIQVNDCIPLIGIDSKLYYEQAYTMWNGKTDFMTFKNMLQEYFRSLDRDYKAVVRPQIYSVLEHLSKHYKIALASSSRLYTINNALDQAGLRKYFSLIVSGEQFKESKPNPEIYLYTIKELNVNKDEAIIIEDSSKGILAANRAGIKVLALKDDKFGLDQSQADIIINELNDIIKLIEKGA